MLIAFPLTQSSIRTDIPISRVTATGFLHRSQYALSIVGPILSRRRVLLVTTTEICAPQCGHDKSYLSARDRIYPPGTWITRENTRS
jgi:hypothetical protein